MGSDHPRTVSENAFISVVYITHHMKCKLLWCSVQVGQVQCFIVQKMIALTHVRVHARVCVVKILKLNLKSICSTQ